MTDNEMFHEWAIGEFVCPEDDTTPLTETFKKIKDSTETFTPEGIFLVDFYAGAANAWIIQRVEDLQKRYVRAYVLGISSTGKTKKKKKNAG